MAAENLLCRWKRSCLYVGLLIVQKLSLIPHNIKGWPFIKSQGSFVHWKAPVVVAFFFSPQQHNWNFFPPLSVILPKALHPKIENKPVSINYGRISGYRELTLASGSFPLPLQNKIVNITAHCVFLVTCNPSRHIYPTNRNYNFVIKTAVKLGDHAEVVKLHFCWHAIIAELPSATKRMFLCFKLEYS